MQMLHQKLQCPVMSWGQLPEEVLDFEENPVELDTHLGWGHWGKTEPQSLELFHNNTLALFGQTNEVVIVAKQDEWLWKLRRRLWKKNE